MRRKTMQKNRLDPHFICTYGALVAGVIIGCILLLGLVVMGKTTVLDYGLEDYDVSVILNASNDEIILHLLTKRFLQIILFFMCVILTNYHSTTLLFCGGFGIYYGFVICNLIIKYGCFGLAYSVICFFPHYFLYFLIVFWVGKWLEKENKLLNKYYGDFRKIEYFVKIFVIIGLFLISMVWEIKFQKNFLNYFFQYLV